MCIVSAGTRLYRLRGDSKMPLKALGGGVDCNHVCTSSFKGLVGCNKAGVTCCKGRSATALAKGRILGTCMCQFKKQGGVISFKRASPVQFLRTLCTVWEEGQGYLLSMVQMRRGSDALSVVLA